MDELRKVNLAKEAARLCSLPDRTIRVAGDSKNDKREKNKKVLSRHCHVDDEETNCEMVRTKFKATGFPNEAGLMKCHNIRADPKLGPGHVAMRMMPCSCDVCVKKLALPWAPGVDASKQACYQPISNCKCDAVLGELNNWFCC